MQGKDLTPVSLAFVGDALYSLRVREYYIREGYRQGKKLQELSKNYVSAVGQYRVYQRLNSAGFFTEEEQEIFRRGRNHIGHIPRNGDKKTYEVATGLETLCGYWYLCEPQRVEAFFLKVFEGGIENE